MTKKKKIILLVALITAILSIGVFSYIYSIAYTGFNIDKTVYIYIDESKDYDKLRHDLERDGKIESISHFDKVVYALNYKDRIRTGRYAIDPGMSVTEFVKDLRSGHQRPVNVTFNNMRTKEDFAERIAEQLMLKYSDLTSILSDSAQCAQCGFTREAIVAMFIPNTYEIYWDISPETFLRRMEREYQKFWTEARLERAKEMKLTPTEVSTLASIVEEECSYADEYPIVAGLYLNRIHRKQLLQADPTVKFALGDFELRRILNKHLRVNSPYNTYRYRGLPPGPIRIPSIAAIDGALNYAKHDYLYMCAKEDFSGRHNFAKTLREHNRNADKYRSALNKRKIY